MTLQTQQPTAENAPAILTDEQRQRVAEALESAQSENTLERTTPASSANSGTGASRKTTRHSRSNPRCLAAYAVELARMTARSMSTIRLAVAAIVDAHRRVGLESPQTGGVTETLRGLSRQIGVSQKQARPLDADALAAIRATALNPRRSRGGSFESEETAIRRGRLDIALASVMSDAGLRISEAAALRWRDVLDAEDGAGLVYIERSKTDQAGEGAYVVVTPDTLTALKQLREDSETWSDDDPVFGLSMSQISRRVDSMARAAGLGEGYSGHSGRVGLAIRMTRTGSSASGGADPRALEVAVDAREVHQEREGAGSIGVACLKDIMEYPG